MIKIGIVPYSPEFGRDRMFDLSPPFNRDHSLQMWHDFRESCRKRGWSVATFDEPAQVFDVYLLLDPYPSKLELLGSRRLKRTLALFCEPPDVAPQQYTRVNLHDVSQTCAAVLCYNEDLCRKYGFMPYTWYSDLYPERSKNVAFSREREGICLIASNKFKRHPESQLDFRLRFAKLVAADSKFSKEFLLYGRNWNHAVGVLQRFVPNFIARRLSIIDKVLVRCEKRLPWNTSLLANFYGPVESKGEVLARCRFNVIVENTFWDGYVSEKVFDALQFGCIPIYFGAPNVKELVPSNLFVDGGDFENSLDAVRAAFALKETELNEMIQAGQNWLKSPDFDARFGRSRNIRRLENLLSTIAEFGIWAENKISNAESGLETSI